MSKKRTAKYRESQCIVWRDSSGMTHRSRFFKPTSVNIIARVFKAKQANVTCYDVEVFSKSKWIALHGPVDPVKKIPSVRIDLSMVELTREMRSWKQKNRGNYGNSSF